MSKASEVKLSRYSLRPKVSAFDLCINQNRYGLVRHTIGRQAKIIPAQCKTTKRELSPTPDSSPSQSRTPSPLPLINKRKIRFQTVENIDAKKTCNAPIVTVPKIWQLPVRTQTVCKPPTILYDVSKVAYFMNMDEVCLFEIFNHLSLHDLCITAEVCSQLKFAAQKYFDILYTAVNLAWLSEDDSGKFTLAQAECLLRNFGHLISTINVNTNQLMATDCKEKLLELIEKYCDGFLFWNAK